MEGGCWRHKEEKAALGRRRHKKREMYERMQGYLCGSDRSFSRICRDEDLAVPFIARYARSRSPVLTSLMSSGAGWTGSPSTGLASGSTLPCV